MSKNEKVINPKVAFAATKALDHMKDDKDTSLHDLKKELSMSYEHTRKLVRGLAFPSPNTLKVMCKFLGLDFEEMSRYTTEAQIKLKHGKAAESLFEVPEDAQDIMTGWAHLTPDQKRDATAMVVGWANANTGGHKKRRSA
jgi:hypothetical protein